LRYSNDESQRSLDMVIFIQWPAVDDVRVEKLAERRETGIAAKYEVRKQK
jgi:hypothetical protein